jgi:hypothetical protein
MNNIALKKQSEPLQPNISQLLPGHKIDKNYSASNATMKVNLLKGQNLVPTNQHKERKRKK